jgi:hypothetical protein
MFLYVVAAFIIIRIIIIILESIDITAWKINPKRKTKYVTGLFVNNFIDSKVLFVARFKEVPSVGVITQVDSCKSYALITERLGHQIVDAHQLNMFDHNEGGCYFTMTIFELADRRMIEIGNGYVEIMYTRPHYEWAMSLLKNLAACKIETEQAEAKAPTVIGFARAMEMN